MGADGILDKGEWVETDIPSIYPQPDAPASFHARDAARRAQYAVRPATEDAEPNAGNCVQCGMPTHDVTVEVECTFCGSDNQTGQKFSTKSRGSR